MVAASREDDMRTFEPEARNVVSRIDGEWEAGR
jgi:hypothetical protein